MSALCVRVRVRVRDATQARRSSGVRADTHASRDSRLRGRVPADLNGGTNALRTRYVLYATSPRSCAEAARAGLAGIRRGAWTSGRGGGGRCESGTRKGEGGLETRKTGKGALAYHTILKCAETRDLLDYVHTDMGTRSARARSAHRALDAGYEDEARALGSRRDHPRGLGIFTRAAA